MNKNKNPTNITSYTQDPGPAKFKFLLLEPLLLGRIFHLGWPVILGMLTQATISTIDLLMVGRLDDTIAVPATAAMLASVVLLWAFGGFLSAISVGTQALAARRFSEGHPEKSGQVLFNSLIISLLASAIITSLALLMVKPAMAFLSASTEVRKIGITYSHIRLLGLPSMAIMASYKSFYDGLGQVRVHMYTAIVMNILNIIFNYIFIFGADFFIFKIYALGPYGAAWGSVLSSYIGVMLIFLWSLRKKDRTRFKIFHLKNWDKNIAWTISKLSVWSGLATVVLMLGVGLFNRIVSTIDAVENTGSANSAATSIIIHVMMLVFMTCLAFGTSTATLVSQSIGAKKPELAQRYVLNCVLLAAYAMGIFGLLAFIFPKPILMLFLPPDLDSNSLKELVINLATPSLRITALLLSPMAGAGMVLTQALYGAGETRFVMIVEFLLHFFCLVPLAWILAIYFNLGLMGCWIAAIVYGAMLTLATGYKFWQGSWKKLNL